jgi:DNA polymerase
MTTPTFDEWRERARPLLIAGIHPDEAMGSMAETAVPEASSEAAGRRLAFPAALMRLLENISCFRAAGRYELMYRLAWRTLFENSKLLEDAADPDVRNATLIDAAIRRDVHKMHAFVRFRSVPGEDGDAYFAWFEPEHEILRRGSPFFVNRFPNMRWTIATPDGSAVWDKAALSFADTPASDVRPTLDAHEDLWRIYYRSICNRARINPTAMQREMPKKYWKNLPEAAEIGTLIRHGHATLMSRNAGKATMPATSRGVDRALTAIPAPRAGPRECRRCDLWQRATQAVAGTGPRDARIMLVGEQPGDEEDLQGQPFVGPAGRVLDQVLIEAGLDRAQLYITNAVKHFKWEPRGKRRLHKRPDLREISACGVWLEREIAALKPRVIVALGATAVRALTGSTLSIEAAQRQSLAHPRRKRDRRDLSSLGHLTSRERSRGRSARRPRAWVDPRAGSRGERMLDSTHALQPFCSSLPGDSRSAVPRPGRGGRVAQHCFRLHRSIAHRQSQDSNARRRGVLYDQRGRRRSEPLSHRAGAYRGRSNSLRAIAAGRRQDTQGSYGLPVW